MLNGKVLTLNGDGTLPSGWASGAQVPSGSSEPLTVPPMTFDCAPL